MVKLDFYNVVNLTPLVNKSIIPKCTDVQYEDATVDHINTSRMLIVQIKQYKANPLDQKLQYLVVEKTDCTVFPFTGILPYLAVRES